jgi:hypothetical protein
MNSSLVGTQDRYLPGGNLDSRFGKSPVWSLTVFPVLWIVFIVRARGQAPYCSSVTFSSQSTALPSSCS